MVMRIMLGLSLIILAMNVWIALIVLEAGNRIDRLDKRVAAIERSVVIMPGGNPTEKPP